MAEISNLETYWNDIPVGRENAVDYVTLRIRWGVSERGVRRILHDLSRYDNGDKYILIRSSKNRGFYKTAKIGEIEQFKRECINRARHTFAPLPKINRVLGTAEQVSIFDYI